MGNCCIKTMLAPPVSKKSFTGSEIYDILYNATKCTNILLYDEAYDSIELEDAQRFCTYNTNYPYKSRRFDCDDIGFAFMARFREWCYSMNGTDGVLIGFIAGNMKIKQTDNDRPHAVCFFIDSSKHIYIIDAMYNEIYEYQPYMVCWSIIM